MKIGIDKDVNVKREHLLHCFKMREVFFAILAK